MDEDHPLAEDFAKLSKELEEEEKIWGTDPRMKGMGLEVDIVNLGMQVNVMLGMLVHAGIIDLMELNINVRKNKLEMMRRIRAQVEEQSAKSRIEVVPGHMAASLRKGPRKA